MLPTIATGNVASALGGAYEVANSCRFNSGDSAHMLRTFGTPSDNLKWTWSGWFKRSVLSLGMMLSYCYTSGGEGGPEIRSGNTIRFRNWISNAAEGNYLTTQL